MSSFIDYTVNGLVIGNIYALLAVGLALIFGVANLINFAHGSVYSIGAYVGWAAITFLHTPLPVTLLIVAVSCGALGAGIERVALRPLQGKARIAPLLATIGLSFVLDQIVQLVASPNPRAVPTDLPDWRINIGGGSIGPMDILIAGVGFGSAALLYGFLRFTKLGYAVRATAQDRDAARQMGVNVDAVNSTVFAIASALGGVSGLLVGMYYNHIDPGYELSGDAEGRCRAGDRRRRQRAGRDRRQPAARPHRELRHRAVRHDLSQPVRLCVADPVSGRVPNGLFGGRKTTEAEPMTGSFVAPSRALSVPPAAHRAR